MPKQEELAPYTIKHEVYETGRNEWRVDGPGIVHWDRAYYHDTRAEADTQAYTLWRAHKMGAASARHDIRRALGLGVGLTNTPNMVVLIEDQLAR